MVSPFPAVVGSVYWRFICYPVQQNQSPGVTTTCFGTECLNIGNEVVSLLPEETYPESNLIQV